MADQRLGKNPRSMSPRIVGIGLALGGAGLFSLKPIFIKLAYRFEIEPLTLLTLRMAMSLPFYLVIGVWVVLRGKDGAVDSRSDFVRIGLIGMLGYYLASYLDMIGLTMTTAQLERLILFAYPTLVVLFGAVFYKQKVPSGAGLALVLTYAGIALIVAHDFSAIGQRTSEGAVLIFISAICFAFFMLESRRYIVKIGSRLYTCIAMSAASLAILVNYFLTRTAEGLFVQVELLKIVFCIAVISTVLPSFMVSAAIQRIGPVRTGIIGSIGPVATAVLAVIILGESFTLIHLLGMVLVIAGIYRISIPRKLAPN